MTLPLSFKELDQIDQKDKDLVNGYVRKLTHLDDLIPNLVIFTVLSFYYIAECWGECGDDVVISNDGRVLTKKQAAISESNWNNTSYGNKWIDSMNKKVHKWTFHIDREAYASMLFGFVAEAVHHNGDFSASTEIINYGMTNTGSIWKHGKYHGLSGVHIREGDTVIITLNLVDRTILFAVDERHEDEITHEDIIQNHDTKYKICVSLLTPNLQITMTNYECITTP